MRKFTHKLASAFIIILVFIIVLYFLQFKLQGAEQQHVLPIQFTVDNYIGLGETQEEDLFFGTVPPGAKGKRTIFLENKAQEPRVVHLAVEGAFASWMEFSENDISLKPGEERTVQVTLQVPSDAEKREYQGMLLIQYR
ncbi:hypothetical protein HYS48_02165 [Candidatus Woesearchaeota archaeon]|nr:hypothetical protein [Candidatus Woesearchaeota archaeon]